MRQAMQVLSALMPNLIWGAMGRPPSRGSIALKGEDVKERTEGRATAATEKGFPSPISRRPHCPAAATVRLGGAGVNGGARRI